MNISIQRSYHGNISDNINDLFDEYCYTRNYTSKLINLKLCVHTRTSNKCFNLSESENENHTVYLKCCNNTKTFSLEVNGVDNETIIYLSYIDINCKGEDSNVILSNFKICKCLL